MLEYFALGMLVFSGIVLFYGIIALHDIPYEIAVRRNHPHQDAIHATGWVSLFTLHALWPFLWIWAMAYRDGRGWGFYNEKALNNYATEIEEKLIDLQHRIECLEGRGEIVSINKPDADAAKGAI